MPRAAANLHKAEESKVMMKKRPWSGKRVGTNGMKERDDCEREGNRRRAALAD